MISSRFAQALALTLAMSSAAPSDAPRDKPQTGPFQLRVPERSPTSAIGVMIERITNVTLEQAKAVAAKEGGEFDYDVAKETFEAHVPRGYTGAEPFGLIVWVSAGPTGHVPQQWLGVLEKRKLIWVGANNSGNNRSKWVRLGLAIDAAEHMQKTYKIDAARVYVSGGSGGGRCASMLAVAFPDVFTGGGYPIIGCNYFRRVDMGVGEDGRVRYFQRHFERPSAKLLQLAMNERRHVLLTGDKDGNREQTQAYAEAMKKDGFKYVTYLQVPGMGHQTPDAEWFEKGIAALDEGREAIAKGEEQKLRDKPKDKPPAKAVQAASAAPPARRATPASDPEQLSPDEEAAKLMRLAKLYINNRMYARAREKLNQIVKDHPKSPPAEEAKKLLKEIGTK